MGNETKRKPAKPRPRKHNPAANGDAGGVSLKQDTNVSLGDKLPSPTSDFVMLADDGWIEVDQ
jgi:hypothetical protein